MTEKIAFISYETPYAPCGGIAAVMGRLPGHMREVTNLDTIVITPFHWRSVKMRSLQLAWVGGVRVAVGTEHEMRVNLGKFIDKNGLAWYFLKAEDEKFFAGDRHPYDVSQEQGEIGPILRRDALFFGKAVNEILPLIDEEAHWTLLMQDWEAATVALASGQKQKKVGLFLTLHNSYDSGGVSEPLLESVGIDPQFCKGPAGRQQATVLERVLNLTAGPVFTVSRQFADDLIHDPVQCKIVAPHLQEQLPLRLYGIDNGPFANLAPEENIVEQARKGDFSGLKEWKSSRKDRAIQALDGLMPSAEKPLWGDMAQFIRDDAPWFVMAGRDDPRQKGYDVAAMAVRRFLSNHGRARFVFFPIPGDEGRDGLSFLKKLAIEFPESVVVLPFIFAEGFTAALQAAAFGLMPSLYEPFGMANEFYLNGTPGIGRATGGILQQIIPSRNVGVFTASVQVRADVWYSPDDRPSGILYREEDGLPSLETDWVGINAAGYDPRGVGPDRIEDRSRFRLIQEMASQLQAALEDGVELFAHPAVYYPMLADGIHHIQGQFSWKKSAGEYWEKIKAVKTRVEK